MTHPFELPRPPAVMAPETASEFISRTRSHPGQPFETLSVVSIDGTHTVRRALQELRARVRYCSLGSPNGSPPAFRHLVPALGGRPDEEATYALYPQKWDWVGNTLKVGCRLFPKQTTPWFVEICFTLHGPTRVDDMQVDIRPWRTPPSE